MTSPKSDSELIEQLNIETCQPGEKWSDYIYRILYKNIMNLTLYPSMQIDEPLIAKRFSCSRTPVREAFSQLQKCNLIDIYPQRGIFVSPIDYDIIRQMQFMRASVEIRVIEKLCQEISPHYQAQLHANLTLQRSIDEIDKSGKTFFPVDKEFHNLCYLAAGYPMVKDIVEQCITHNDRLTYLLILNDLPYQERSLREHEEIFQSILDHDAKRGVEIVLQHRMEYKNLPPLENLDHYFRNYDLLKTPL